MELKPHSSYTCHAWMACVLWFATSSLSCITVSAVVHCLLTLAPQCSTFPKYYDYQTCPLLESYRCNINILFVKSQIEDCLELNFKYVDYQTLAHLSYSSYVCWTSECNISECNRRWKKVTLYFTMYFWMWFYISTYYNTFLVLKIVPVSACLVALMIWHSFYRA